METFSNHTTALFAAQNSASLPNTQPSSPSHSRVWRLKGIIPGVLLLGVFITSLLGGRAWGQTTSSEINGGNTSYGNTDVAPVDTYYGYNYTQMIYTASELTSAGLTSGSSISGLLFYYATDGGTEANFDDWVIYLGNTSTSSFNTSTSWIATSNMSSVFNSTVTFPAAGNWMTINFSSNFTWNGTSNIVIAVDENSPGYQSNVAPWRATDVSGSNSEVIYYSDDSTNPNPTSPPTAKGTFTWRPIIMLKYCSPPAAFTISGAASPCVGSSQTYTASSGSGSVSWTFPSGWTITAGSSSATCTVTVGANSGSISCTRTSSGCSTTSTNSITAAPTNVPSQPSSITGTLNPVPGATGVTYSVTNVAGTTYTWSVPSGWTITGGQNTNQITVTVGSTNGTISVTPSNACGNGTARAATTTIPNYRYEVTSASLGSATWCAGESRNVSVTVKNTGVTTWSNSSPDINVGVKWASNGLNWNDYHVRTDAGALAPGASQTYTLTINSTNATSGPTYSTDLSAGTNYLYFDLVYEGCFWFGTNPGTICSVTSSGNTVYQSAAITIVNATPSISVVETSGTSNDGTLCSAGVTAALNASGATTYSWSPSTNLSASTGGSVTYTAGSTTAYTVTGTSSSCTATASTTITVLNNTTFYSKSTGNLDVLTNWGSNTDGTGCSPANFSTAGITYIIQNNSTPTTSASGWSVSGSGSIVKVGNGSSAITFTAGGNLTFTCDLEITGNATLSLGSNNMTLSGDFVRSASTAGFSQTAGSASTVTFSGSSQEVNVTAFNGTTPTDSDITFNHVVIDGTSVKLFYFKTNDRKLNINNFTVNTGKVVTLYSNPQ